MFDDNFTLYVVGRRNSGKSHCLISMLIHPKLMYKKFDEIYIINPTYRFDEKYHVIKFDHVYEEFSLELLEELKLRFEEEPEKKKLLILDDCISQESFKSNEGTHILNEMALNGRHWGLSLCILSQKFIGTSTYIRAQLDYVLLFDTSNNNEKDTIYGEFGTGTKKEFYAFFDSTFTKKHDTLLIDTTSGNISYYKNFIKIK
jgi:hypothetical protein